MTFKGWPKSMIEFYSELEVNNTKDFWTEHKDTYDNDVRAPMEALVAELSEEFGEGKIFRPYRDVRFSKDKTPYKTETAALFGTPGGGGYYVRVSADGIGAGGGYHHMAGDQIDRFRGAVNEDLSGEEIEVLVDTLRKSKFAIGGEALKTVPRGFPKDHPRGELLRLKGIHFFREAPAGPKVHSKAALAWVQDSFRAGAELLAWLDKHVGPSTTPNLRGRR